ncbi:MAG TPA: serine hydrolase [Gemmatimonadaceae bacterium]|nr:serine hydrolase [Gemmatimonadaceae bacterium]
MTTLFRVATLAMLTLTAAPLARAQQPARSASGLQRLLDAELARFPAKAGVWVKHLTTGEEASVRGDEAFNSASVIKIPVMVLAFQMADKGQLSLSERITINASDFRGGSGVFRYNDPGLQPTFRDVLLQMIITSDNTATDLAIAKVGGVAKVNEWLRGAGYGDALTLNMTTGDLFAKYGALPQSANRNEKTNADKAYWLGSMTPRGTGRLIEAIQRCADGTAPSPAIAAKKSCEDMIRMMRAQQSGARRLPHFLSVAVAHKTGDFPPVLANDVGVIFARSGPIVVSFFTNAIEGPYAETEDRIGRVAQLIVEYFDGSTP